MFNKRGKGRTKRVASNARFRAGSLDLMFTVPRGRSGSMQFTPRLSVKKQKIRSQKSFVFKKGEISMTVNSKGFPMATKNGTAPPKVSMDRLSLAFLEIPDVKLHDVMMVRINCSTTKSFFNLNPAQMKSGYVQLQNGLLTILNYDHTVARQRPTMVRKKSKADSRLLRTPASPLPPKRKMSSIMRTKSKESQAIGMDMEEQYESVFHISQLVDIVYRGHKNREFTLVFCEESQGEKFETKFVEVSFRAETQEKAIAWLKHVFLSVSQMRKFILYMYEELVNGDCKENWCKEKLKNAWNICERYMRCYVDLCFLLHGFKTMESVEAVEKMLEFLRTRRCLNEVSFWEECVENMRLDVAKEGECDSMFDPALEEIRQQFLLNGIV